MKREWRLARKDFVLELPAGFIEVENPSETDIRDAANRELQEEIGIKAEKLTLLSSFQTSNYLTMTTHFFLGQALSASILPHDEHEYIEVKKLPFKEAYQFITNQSYPVVSALLAFHLVSIYLHLPLE